MAELERRRAEDPEYQIDVDTRFADFEDLWNPFLGGQGSAPPTRPDPTGPRAWALRPTFRLDVCVRRPDLT